VRQIGAELLADGDRGHGVNERCTLGDRGRCQAPGFENLLTGHQSARITLKPFDEGFTVGQVIQGEKTAEPGAYVMVYDQIGFHQATATAEWLAEKGCKVEIVTPQFYAGGDLSVTLDLELWYRRVLAKDMQLTADHFLASLGPNSAVIINNYTGQPRQLENLALAVMATPQVSNDSLYHQLQGKVKQLYRVGDCVAPRRVENAILDGERAARALL